MAMKDNPITDRSDLQKNEKKINELLTSGDISYIERRQLVDWLKDIKAKKNKITE